MMHWIKILRAEIFKKIKNCYGPAQKPNNRIPMTHSRVTVPLVVCLFVMEEKCGAVALQSESIEVE